MSDGRNPDWEAGSVALDLWEAVLDHYRRQSLELSGPDVGRLRLALDTLAEAAELSKLAKDLESARDAIAAYAGARAARKAASDLVAELTGARRDPRGGHNRKEGPVHGHRTQKEKQVRNSPDALADDDEE